MYERNQGPRQGAGTVTMPQEQNRADQAKQKAGQAMDEAQRKAGEAADQAQQKAGEALSQAQNQIKSRAEGQKERVTRQLDGVAQALRQSSHELRSHEQEPVAQYVERGADQIERVSRYIDGHSVDELVGDVESFARREPALFVGGAFAIGFLGARFLKSSRRLSDGHHPTGQPPTGGYPTGGYRPTTTAAPGAPDYSPGTATAGS